MTPRVRLFVIVVAIAGCGLAAGLIFSTSVDARWTGSGFVVLAALAILGELFPVRVPFRHEAQEITLSTTFVLAILVTQGVAAAIAVQLVGSLLSDAHLRKVWWKAGFNVGQYSIAWAVAGGVLLLLHGSPYGATTSFTLTELGAIVLVGMTFFVVNSTLVSVPIAVTTNVPVIGYLWRDFGFHASTALVLTSLSPIVIVLAADQPGLVPLLLLPIAAVHKSARISIDKDYQAHHDALTGLPNRPAFREWIEQTIAAAPTDRLAVLIIDLDSFKEVNDTLGHQMGDRLLCSVADRLADEFDDDCSVARLGGDEFAIAVSVRADAEVIALGPRVGDALSEPIELDGLLLPATGSVGAACYPRDGDNVDTLLQRADVAMYLAKGQQTSFELYQPERDRHTTRRLSLLGELHQAMEDRELVFHFQPVAELATGRITSTEALIRWEHPRHGLIPPDEFVPLAEPTGLIEPLTAYALHHALRQCRAWLDQGRTVGVAVNVSVRNLYEANFAGKVSRHLALERVPPELLTLEITEGTVMADPIRAATVLDELHAMGVRIAIDDFGTGYSSLVHLKRLPVDTIKIDRSFVMNMASDDDAAIVRSTIDLAHNLGLKVVAEGVETESHWRQLAALGCDYGQGYFIARPAPAERIELTALVAVAAGVGSPAAPTAVS
jgi:diguanylate cyclase (GGDEF)-like protein